MAIIQWKCATGVGRRSIIRERKLSWCLSVCVQDAALRKETYSIKAKNNVGKFPGAPILIS